MEIADAVALSIELGMIMLNVLGDYGRSLREPVKIDYSDSARSWSDALQSECTRPFNASLSL